MTNGSADKKYGTRGSTFSDTKQKVSSQLWNSIGVPGSEKKADMEDTFGRRVTKKRMKVGRNLKYAQEENEIKAQKRTLAKTSSCMVCVLTQCNLQEQKSVKDSIRSEHTGVNSRKLGAALKEAFCRTICQRFLLRSFDIFAAPARLSLETGTEAKYTK